MAVTYRSSGTIVAGGDVGVDMSSSLPSGLAIDDIMVFVGLDADNEHFDAGLPSGWTSIFSDDTSTGAGGTFAWKRYDGTETDWQFDTPSNAGQLVMGVIHAFTGAIETGTPYTSLSTLTASARTSHSAGSGTNDSTTLAVSFLAIEDNVAVTKVDTSGTWTERDNQSTTQGSDGRVICSTSVTNGTVEQTYTTGTSELSLGLLLKFIPDTDRPTIAPNTADAHDFGADDTPSLEFTGSDANADDLEYEFDLLSALDFIIDSHDVTLISDVELNTNAGIGQSFTGDGKRLEKASFLLRKKTGSPTGTVRYALYAHTGTFGGGGFATGFALALSETKDVSTLTTTITETILSFLNPFTLVNGTNYVLIPIHIGNGSATDNIGVGYGANSHSGNATVYNRTTGVFSGSISEDYLFKAYGHVEEFVTKKSVTPDATFTNTVSGGDTHPFNEAEKIDYTVQVADALADGTWYWRARAIDPTGTNEWSDFTTIRSFDTGSPDGAIDSQITTSSTTSADIEGRGALADSSTTSSTTSADLVGHIQQTSHINTSSTTSADIRACIKGVSHINTSSTTSQDIEGRLDADSSITTDSTTSADLGGVGQLVSHVTTSSTTTSAIVEGGSAEQGISHITTSSVTSAQLDGTGSIGSTINTLSTTSGILLGRGSLDSDINTSSTTLSELLGVGELTSSINTDSTTSATGELKGNLDSSINTSSTTLNDIKGVGELTTSINTDSTTSASISDGGSVVQGQSFITTSSTTLADLLGVGELQDTATTSSTQTSSLIGVGELASDINTTSTTSATISSTGTASGVSHITTSSAQSSDLIGTGALASDINTSSTTSSSINGAGAVSGVSNINTSSSTSADLGGFIGGVSNITTDSTTLADIQATGQLASSVNTQSTTLNELLGVGQLSTTISTFTITTASIFDGSNKQKEIDSQTSTMTLVKSKTSDLDVIDLQTSNTILTDSKVSNLF